jgi:uncharacterized delta-60 repeat protein
MGRRTALLLLPALIALCLGAAGSRAAASEGRLDPSFGSAGTATVTAPGAEEGIGGFEVAPDGRVYVLAGSVLLAFGPNGEPAAEFGEDGQLKVAPAVGEGEATGLALDPEGRPLVIGSSHPEGQRIYTAFLIRFLPDGSRDPSFGDGGEVDPTFGLPAATGGEAVSVRPSSLFVDGQGRIVVGGAFGTAGETCGVTIGSGLDPFVGRLTSSGAADTTFAGSGHVALGGPGSVGSVATTPGGGVAAFDYRCATPPRYEPSGATAVFLDEGGAKASRERPLGFGYSAPRIDPKGRVVHIDGPPPIAEGGHDVLTRERPGGGSDPTFGHKGRVVLDHGLHAARSFALDPRGRPVIAEAGGRIELRRFHLNGSVDKRFGPGGRLTAKGRPPSAIAFGPGGLIYTLTLSHTSSGAQIEIARFIPGR